MSDARTSIGAGVASWTVERWVRRHSSLTGAAFAVSLTVASMHSSTTGYAHPSMKSLANAARVSVKTVSRAIAEMKDSGEWVVVTGRGGAANRASLGANSTPRANRYYPTALLRDGSASRSLMTSRERILANLVGALDAIGISNQREREVFHAMVSALPEPHARILVSLIKVPTDLSRVESLKSLLLTLPEGVDLPKLISARMPDPVVPPRQVLSWLVTDGLVDVEHGLYVNSEQSDEFIAGF